MVVVGGSGDHHAATHNRASFISAPEFVIAEGLPRPIYTSASGARPRGPRFLVRSLHDLSASANSQDSPPTDRTRRTLSFDQRKCCGHDCGRRFGRAQNFQQYLFIRKYWGIRRKNFRSHPGSSRFIRKTASGLRKLPRKPNNRGWGQSWNIVSVTRMAIGWCWNPLQASSATKRANRKNL